jgi:exopolysaccharide/PEP-CTERM locus tyrosine autokinase
MSIVEKAVEKLKTLPVGSPASLPAETPPHAAPTIERLQERTRVADRPVEPVPSYHVDSGALKRMGLLPADSEADRKLADELRRIKRPLLDNAMGQGAETLSHGNRIMVTSAEAGEGKTFAAINLALSLAKESDFEVLLVDGDIPKSDITHIFGLDGKPGLMDAVADEQIAPAEIIIPTDVPNMLVVPAGTRHALAAELFRSRRMQYVLDELGGRNRRRLVVFDSAPLLLAPESHVLASHMGQVVVMVAAGRTRRQAVHAAVRSFHDYQFVGLVLNMSRLPAGEDYHNHHYGNHLRALKGEA